MRSEGRAHKIVQDIHSRSQKHHLFLSEARWRLESVRSSDQAIPASIHPSISRCATDTTRGVEEEAPSVFPPSRPLSPSLHRHGIGTGLCGVLLMNTDIAKAAARARSVGRHSRSAC